MWAWLPRVPSGDRVSMQLQVCVLLPHHVRNMQRNFHSVLVLVVIATVTWRNLQSFSISTWCEKNLARSLFIYNFITQCTGYHKDIWLNQSTSFIILFFSFVFYFFVFYFLQLLTSVIGNFSLVVCYIFFEVLILHRCRSFKLPSRPFTFYHSHCMVLHLKYFIYHLHFFHADIYLFFVVFKKKSDLK